MAGCYPIDRSLRRETYAYKDMIAPEDTLFCVPIEFCMPSITVNVDDDLKERMENHPEINWSEVTRQAIQEKIEALEMMDELTSESDLTEHDVQEIANKINEQGRKRVEEESA